MATWAPKINGNALAIEQLIAQEQAKKAGLPPELLMSRMPQGEVVQPQIEGVQTNAQPTVEPTDQAPAMDPRDDYPIIKEDPQARALRQALQKDIQRGITEQDAAVKAAQAIPSQLDLSPLLALTDSMYGSKLQSGYNKPMRPEERQQLEVSLRKVAQAERQGLLNSIQKSPQEKIYEAMFKSKQTNKRAEEREINELRKEALGSIQYKNFSEARNAYEQIQKVIENPTAYGDVAAMFTFMKALDPDSVVREGEQLLFRKTGSISESVANSLNKLVEGKTLQPKQRAEIEAVAKKLVEVRQKSFERRFEPVKAKALRRGYSLSEIYDPETDKITQKNVIDSVLKNPEDMTDEELAAEAAKYGR